jgi:hypothetical protein
MPGQASGDRRYPRPLAEVRRATQQALARLGWSWKPSDDGGFDAVCVARILKSKDDVAIRFVSANGTFVRVQSMSRLGFFDLGQNPKHVQEFFEELERQLPRVAVRV